MNSYHYRTTNNNNNATSNIILIYIYIYIYIYYGHAFYVHINKTYPLSMEASVNVFLAQSTAFLQPDMIVCGCTFDATSCSASYHVAQNETLVKL